jgi:hypothetical protein
MANERGLLFSEVMVLSRVYLFLLSELAAFVGASQSP